MIATRTTSTVARAGSTELAHARDVAEKIALPLRRCPAVLVGAGRSSVVTCNWLADHSIALLRISVGVIALVFGILKFLPGASPAENLVVATSYVLTFGAVPGKVAIIGVATVECIIGLSLIFGWGLRVSIYLVIPWSIGILSPIVLLPQRLFNGPEHTPTLEGQYVLKDIIILAAALVIGSTLRRGELNHEITSVGDVHAVSSTSR